MCVAGERVQIFPAADTFRPNRVRSGPNSDLLFRVLLCGWWLKAVCSCLPSVHVAWSLQMGKDIQPNPKSCWVQHILHTQDARALQLAVLHA